jgi:hypothetical protein
MRQLELACATETRRRKNPSTTAGAAIALEDKVLSEALRLMAAAIIAVARREKKETGDER